MPKHKTVKKAKEAVKKPVAEQKVELRREDSVLEKQAFLEKEEQRTCKLVNGDTIVGDARCPLCMHPMVGCMTRRGPKFLCACVGHSIYEEK